MMCIKSYWLMTSYKSMICTMSLYDTYVFHFRIASIKKTTKWKQSNHFYRMNCEIVVVFIHLYNEWMRKKNLFFIDFSLLKHLCCYTNVDLMRFGVRWWNESGLFSQNKCTNFVEFPTQRPLPIYCPTVQWFVSFSLAHQI